MIIGTNGELQMPYRKEILKEIGPNYIRHIDRMWKGLWQTYIVNKGTTSTPYYADKILNAVVINKVLKLWSDAAWIIVSTKPNANWSEMRINEDKLLEYFSSHQLESIRANNKFKKYMLQSTLATESNTTKINGKIKDTGLNRPGFLATANVPFQFDTETLQEYYKVVRKEAIKSMDKVRNKYPEMRRDQASYDEVITATLDYIITTNGTYRSGQFHSDSRGRNIQGYLDKIFNPVSFKCARALLVIPETHRQTATDNGLKNKYLFIAELLGFKQGTVQEKIDYGRDCYYRNKYHNLDWDDEEDRKEAYENIWLDRTYKDIDLYLDIDNNYKARIYMNRYCESSSTLAEAQAIIESNPTTHKWVVPIEIDMSASVLGYLGLLMNHKPFLERCNMLGDTLVDAWDIKGIAKRNQAKVIMRTIYGSSMSCTEMWKDKNIDFTAEDVKAYEDALDHGEIALGDRFSKFIINNCNPSENMTLHVRDEQFAVECNRYKYIGEHLDVYDLYDSASKSIKRIHHTTTKRIPDLKQFRRFMVTGLIHNLDAQVEDTTVLSVVQVYHWAEDLHDAIILCAEAADHARGVYASELEDIHTNRISILENYFHSIGIPASSITEWQKVLEVVEPLTNGFKCNKMVLK